MSNAYKCDGCSELKEGQPHRWTSVRDPPETKGESRDYCKVVGRSARPLPEFLPGQRFDSVVGRPAFGGVFNYD